MPNVKEEKKDANFSDEMLEIGAHVGYKKSKKHPSTGRFIYGVKNGVEIFDLEETTKALEKALDYIKGLGKADEPILFVGTKNEARKIVKEAAMGIDLPHVTHRWIGGTLTNWSEIQKRVSKMKDLREKREKGELEKYTKKEQLLIDRDIESLERKYEGIASLDKMPKALFVIDPDHEEIAVQEADQTGIKVIALANNDCDISTVEYPIPANDATVGSINYFVSKVTNAYREGQIRKDK